MPFQNKVATAVAICMSKILGGLPRSQPWKTNTWQRLLRMHVCLAHSSSNAVISSYSVGIGRSVEGHLQAELEGTAAVTVCKPYSKWHKCPSGEVQDAYFIAQKVHKRSHTKLSSTKFGVDSFEQGDRIANAMCDCDVPQVLPALFPRDHY